jgi:hypothetical protein
MYDSGLQASAPPPANAFSPSWTDSAARPPWWPPPPPPSTWSLIAWRTRAASATSARCAAASWRRWTACGRAWLAASAAGICVRPRQAADATPMTGAIPDRPSVGSATIPLLRWGQKMWNCHELLFNFNLISFTFLKYLMHRSFELENIPQQATPNI